MGARWYESKNDTKLTLTIPKDTPDGSKIVLNSPKLKEPFVLVYRDKGIPFFESYNKSYLFGKDLLWTDQNYLTDGTHKSDPISPVGISYFRRKNTYSA